MSVNQFMPMVLLLGSVTPGTQQFEAGTHSFVVPEFNTLTITMWGGGASGSNPTVAGNASTITSLGLTAGGGLTGSISVNGAGGTATGGDTNTTGGTGAVRGDGGDAPGGGAGGLRWASGANQNGRPGEVPGGGGAGRRLANNDYGSGGGGSRLIKTYTPANLLPGTNLELVVADSAISSFGGAGAAGRIIITWS